MIAQMHRRRFLAATGVAMAALAASACSRAGLANSAGQSTSGYGPLVPDPQGFFDLPENFSYRVISRLGDAMDDGFTVPDKADGMGCFDLGKGKLALVRNHELVPGRDDSGGVTGPAFDYFGKSLIPLPGGTTTLVVDVATLKVEKQFRSLAGTIRNCAGGTTPWGSWLSCEENVARSDGKINQDHGWVFEVPSSAPGLVEPVPLKAMGRFYHEAACIDPATGVVYMTEDRADGVFYRFIPNVPGQLHQGGRLQALALVDGTGDTRNWDAVAVAPGSRRAVRWVDCTDVESPEDDLRVRAAASGAALFARGEGIHMGDGELYFCCTSGGAAKLGQVFRLTPGKRGRADMLELFFESTSERQFNFGDNLTVAPNGHLVVCEDQYTPVVNNRLIGITPSGEPYVLALLHAQTELAGACFSPDGKVLFVNAFAPAATLAITGPWLHLA